MLKNSSLQHCSLRFSLLLKLSHLSNALSVFSYDVVIGHFRVPPGLFFKTRVGAQPLLWKSFFIPMQIKLIFTRTSLILKVKVFGTRRWPIKCFHSHGQHLCKFIGTKESVCIRKEFNSHRIGLGHQHGRRFIVLGHQYGRRDVM